MAISNEAEEETHQQIESVINMFPQPTADQIEEFNELQQNSQSEISQLPIHRPTPDDPGPIRNLELGLEKFNKGPNEFMRNSHQHNQIASQQIKQDEQQPGRIPEDRRVRTTNPG